MHYAYSVTSESHVVSPQYIHYLLMILEDNYKRPLTPGIFDRPDSRLVVWNEICRVADAKGGDVYGMTCRVWCGAPLGGTDCLKM